MKLPADQELSSIAIARNFDFEMRIIVASKRIGLPPVSAPKGASERLGFARSRYSGTAGARNRLPPSRLATVIDRGYRRLGT